VPASAFTHDDVVRMLKIAPALGCPHRLGCKCRDCYGLAECLDEQRIDHDLPSTVRLRVSTFTDPAAPDITAPACTGTMTCTCHRCEDERAQAVAMGSRHRPQADPLRALRRAA
jgi:hypothetical protein